MRGGACRVAVGRTLPKVSGGLQHAATGLARTLSTTANSGATWAAPSTAVGHDWKATQTVPEQLGKVTWRPTARERGRTEPDLAEPQLANHSSSLSKLPPQPPVMLAICLMNMASAASVYSMGVHSSVRKVPSSRGSRVTSVRSV
jgi:hypothetical protein